MDNSELTALAGWGSERGLAFKGQHPCSPKIDSSSLILPHHHTKPFSTLMDYRSRLFISFFLTLTMPHPPPYTLFFPDTPGNASSRTKPPKRRLSSAYNYAEQIVEIGEIRRDWIGFEVRWWLQLFMSFLVCLGTRGQILVYVRKEKLRTSAIGIAK